MSESPFLPVASQMLILYTTSKILPLPLEIMSDIREKNFGKEEKGEEFRIY